MDIIAALMAASNSVVTPATVSYTASAVDATDRNPANYTFSGQALGTAASDRKIVVGAQVFGNATYSLDSVTVAGISATRLVTVTSNSGGVDLVVELWQASVPTGTTGDVVVSASSGNSSWCSVGVWAVYGAGASAYDTGSSTANPMTDTLNIPANGVAIGFGASRDGTSYTWTNLTEDFDALVETGLCWHSGASDEFASAQSALSITQDPADASPTWRAFVLVSFNHA